MKKPLKIVLLLSFTAALLATPFVVAEKWHDRQLAQLQNEVGALPHPVDSKLLARHGEIENFGNGNHLDYWAVEVRSAPNPRAAKGLYRFLRVPVPNANNDDSSDVKNGTQPIEVTILPSPLPTNYHLKAGNSAWNLSALAGQSGLYAVEIVNSGENNSLQTLFDLRGN